MAQSGLGPWLKVRWVGIKFERSTDPMIIDSMITACIIF